MSAKMFLVHAIINEWNLNKDATLPSDSMGFTESLPAALSEKNIKSIIQHV